MASVFLFFFIVTPIHLIVGFMYSMVFYRKGHRRKGQKSAIGRTEDSALEGLKGATGGTEGCHWKD